MTLDPPLARTCYGKCPARVRVKRQASWQHMYRSLHAACMHRPTHHNQIKSKIFVFKVLRTNISCILFWYLTAQLQLFTPFCVSLWSLGITFVRIRHIDGATTGRLVTKNHHCAKLFGGPLLQLGIERKIQQYAKQIGIGTKDSSWSKLFVIEQPGIDDWPKPSMYISAFRKTDQQWT